MIRSTVQKSSYRQLRNKWTARHRALQKELWEKHGDSFHWIKNNVKQIAAGSLGGLLLLSAPAVGLLLGPHLAIAEDASPLEFHKRVFVISDLMQVLPEEMRVLTSEEEQKVSQILSRDFGLKVSAELGGKRLNRTYGLIGAEQHLARYPEDTIYTHFDSEEERREFGASGMAPGLGAWRYFANSRDELTEGDKLREKYYIAVQTFLSPEFSERVSEYRDFFRFRKMLVVNPQNGHAVVADIADAGPAEWTGKHLGGSPELMAYLERVDGAARGAVLYFFIDDPGDTIPLGPIEAK